MAYNPEKTRANTSGETSGSTPKPPVDPNKAKKVGGAAIRGSGK
ncbi:hypothetical protein [Blastococcus sp. CT_GayMR16]|nr:hypothetical protein [Blastococcus sp. CT_GayMR16]